MLFHHSLDGFNNTIEIVSKSIAILLEAVIRYFKKKYSGGDEKKTKPDGSMIPLPSDCFLFDLLEPCDVRAIPIRKTADLPLQLRFGTFPRFVAIGFYFVSETLI